jgi:hypothetical protein
VEDCQAPRLVLLFIVDFGAVHPYMVEAPIGCLMGAPIGQAPRSNEGGGLGASPILLLMFKLHTLIMQADAPPLIGFGGPAGLLLNSTFTELRHQNSGVVKGPLGGS